MVLFGDSKHEPVKPAHSLLDITPSKLVLSDKGTIHDVELNLTGVRWFFRPSKTSIFEAFNLLIILL
jgi:hypothetical protein